MTLMPFDDLVDRSRAVLDAAGRTCASAGRLVHEARCSRQRSAQVRHAAQLLRHRNDPPLHLRRSAGLAEAFTISGQVDGVPVSARWSRAHGLVCPPELLQRAQAVVAMGDTFGGRVGLPVVEASLDGDVSSTAVLLAVLRAFSAVTSLDLVTHVSETIDIDVADVDTDDLG
jgi:hypothetical protein